MLCIICRCVEYDVTKRCPIKELEAGTREFEDVRGKMESDSGESTGGLIDLSQLSKLSAGGG